MSCPRRPGRALLATSDRPIAGRGIRLGEGTVDVSAARRGTTYATVLSTHRLRLDTLTVGQTLAPGAHVLRVRLDGRRTRWSARVTNRGREVSVRTRPGRHMLAVKVHR